ncbi:MAG: HEAT repeat domain-containing protein [Phycisphaerales bacterium]|nr:MAG: HEAT repeat domain-containing protein [Phycisphaerales bacterium]
MMNKKRHKKDATPSKTNSSVDKKNLLKKEWPLLLIPALVLIALSVLYTAHRSLQEELPNGNMPNMPGGNSTATATGQPDAHGNPTVPEANIPVPADPGTMTANQTGAMPATGDPNSSDTQAPGSSGATAGALGSRDASAVANLASTLRQALQQQDHARIKQVMDDLAALGEDAVLELGEIIASGTDETALWAAEALARIGTPAAAAALLDTLEQVQDGPYKEQLAKRTSNISNHDSWPLLLDAVQASEDRAVQRAAATSLGRMADTAVVDEIVARYDAASTPEEADLLVQVVSNISSSKASAALRNLAGSVSSTTLDSLQQAALEAMAAIGDTQSVNYLLQRLESSPPGRGSRLYNTITSIDRPQAEAALRYAAAGSKGVSAEQGRTAAISALQNYPSEETYRLLEQIAASSDNAAVVTAALRTLESIEKNQPAIAERATSKADTTDLLPVDPLKK